MSSVKRHRHTCYPGIDFSAPPAVERFNKRIHAYMNFLCVSPRCANNLTTRTITSLNQGISFPWKGNFVIRITSLCSRVRLYMNNYSVDNHNFQTLLSVNKYSASHAQTGLPSLCSIAGNGATLGFESGDVTSCTRAVFTLLI